MNKWPKIENAPGLIWRKYPKGFAARWQPRPEIVRAGFRPRGRLLWSGKEFPSGEAERIANECRDLHTKMLEWYRRCDAFSPRPRGRAYIWLVEHKTEARNDCLIWPFTRDGNGRGQLKFNGKWEKAHRIMCELVYGPSPEGKPHAAHNCGNGHLGCVNPRHLQWKSQSENEHDKNIHGTSRRFTNTGERRKLTESAVREIRQLDGKFNHREIAKRFGVCERTIGSVIARKTWAHIA